MVSFVSFRSLMSTCKSLVYSFEELRPIRPMVDRTRTLLSQFIEQYKSIEDFQCETRLLNRSVYKNWNARHAEPGIQASRRTTRLLERFLNERFTNLDDILRLFQSDAVEIRLPSRGTLNEILTKVHKSKTMLKKIEQQSKFAVDRLRLECSRTNYVQYNILIMSVCSRIYFLSLSLIKVQDEFCQQVKPLLKVFKKKEKNI